MEEYFAERQVKKEKERYHKNYYTKNNLCYTQDHVLIQELYIYGVPTKLEKKELLTYFNSCGNVVNLELSDTIMTSFKLKKGHEAHWRYLKTGRVLFANPLHAAQALLSEIHFVNQHSVHVNASDSWLQPEAYGPSEQSYLSKIPDECLVRILEFLPLIDQIHFLRYCTPLRDVYELDTRSFQKTVDFEIFNNFTIWDIRDYFYIFGRNVQSFKGSIWLSTECDQFFDFFGTSCVNLKSLKLSDTPLSRNDIYKMFAKTNKLEHVELNNCQLDNHSLGALRNLKKLKSLSLAKNPNIWHGFEQLPISIKTLNLCKCNKYMLRDNGITDCKALPKVKNLNIVGMDYLHPYVYGYLTSIETLRCSISEDTDYKKTAKLPNLKRIEIAGKIHEFTFGKFLNYLVSIKSHQLVELAIWYSIELTKQVFVPIAKLSELKKLSLSLAYEVDDRILSEFTKLKKLEHIFLAICPYISDSGVTSLILGCPKLRVVNLSWSDGITENLVHNIIKNVKRQNFYMDNERELPVHLYVGGTKIRETINTNPNVIAAKNIIKILFSLPTKDCYDYSLRYP